MAKDFQYADPKLADKLIAAIAKDTKIVVDLNGLVEQTTRLAAATERIADALEAQRDDPDAYEYRSIGGTWSVEDSRREGFKVYQITTEGYYMMRRPRQQDTELSDHIARENGLLDDEPDEPLDYPGEWGES